MLPLLAPYLSSFWGPLRLLGSYLVLIGLGSVAAGLLVWWALPRLAARLPRDRGRAHTPTAQAALGKPTGAGYYLFLLLLPVLALVLPLDTRLWGAILGLGLAMLTGYLDDRSLTPWGEWRKGLLDLAIAAGVALALCQGRPTALWLPVYKQALVVPCWLYVIIAGAVLWLAVNATNCSDGVDGLAGSLTLLSLLYLGMFLYVIVGHSQAARYLLVPHNPAGARWGLLLFVTAGGLAGYLWHNAEPSRILMGDAGSRFLGLLVGVAVLAAGNPALILVTAPVVLANGGTGLVKVALLRIFKRLGFDIAPPVPGGAPRRFTPRDLVSPDLMIHMLHRVRFPLHDHCRKNLGWSNAQVLLRFVLIQAFLTPILLVLLVKLR